MKSKVLLLALATTAFSLASKAQISFGVRAGVNFQNINGEDYTGKDLDYDLKTGFHIGVNAEVPVAPDFYVQPGLLFSTKGAKQEVANSSNDIKIKLSYIEVPINVLYKPTLGPGKLLLGFGPYIGFGVGGKYVDAADKDHDIKFDGDVKTAEYNSNYYYAKRMDFGGNLLFGYELASKISFQLNAQLGMTKINPKYEFINSEDAKFKNTGFGFSVGYRF
jgi:hypothetical protein